MTYSVTSWFVEQTLKKTSEPVRKFTIGSSDYSDRVLKWPSFSRSWNDIRPSNANMSLANEDKLINFFIEDKTNLRKEAKIQLGFTHPTSGDELITLFSGNVESVKYDRGTASLSIVNKFKQLTERIVGTSKDPVDYTTSDYNPADIAWYLVTSHGGYSAIASDSNPDIDYSAWSEWWTRFDDDNVTIRALFNGQKVSEGLRKIGRITLSAIYEEQSKFSFKRFSIADVNVTSLTEENIIDNQVTIGDDTMVNRQYVFADYVPSSKFYQITVISEDTPSVNSFGIKEEVEKDSVVWYPNSIGALNLAQRSTQTNDIPHEQLKVRVGLVGVVRTIGETLNVKDSLLGIDKGFRILNQRFNLDTGRIDYGVNRSQFFNGFTLDVSTLDGPDVLT